MLRIIIVLAVLFFLTGLVMHPPVTLSDTAPVTILAYTIGQPQPIVRSVDLTPVLGLVAIGVFLSWFAKQGER